MGTEPAFGGDWTEEKLARLRKYLPAYMQIMKSRPYRTIYVDAFAGAGYRKEPSRSDSDEPTFPELAEPEVVRFRAGSARIALECRPSFDHYIFVDRDPNNAARLATLRTEYASLDGRIEIIRSDANAFLKQWCAETNWRGSTGSRAVVFLDPFGMQVSWDTVEAIARTHAIDLWLLVPLGIAVNRLLPRKSPPPDSWARSLDRFFGTNAWREAFYRPSPQPSLFDADPGEVRAADYDAVGAFFLERLRTIFPAVANNPLPLMNSRQDRPLYLLCFATGNPNAPSAIKIAQHILRR